MTIAVDNNHAPHGNLGPQSELSDVEALKASGALDEVLAKIDAGQVQITGEGGRITGGDAHLSWSLASR